MFIDRLHHCRPPAGSSGYLLRANNWEWEKVLGIKWGRKRRYKSNALLVPDPFLIRFRAFITLVASAIATSDCHAEVMFLGPTPYLSRADSPFPVDGSNPTFFLEDFEDGELNTPGIRQQDIFPPEFGGVFVGSVMSPGTFTDSVDADDGVIDGDGRGGHSFRSGIQLFIDTFPPRQQSLILFAFDESVLGFLPNAFGFVWTDGRENASLLLTVTTRSGTQLSTPIFEVGDAVRDGTTNDDRFVAITTMEGIASARIVSGYTGTSPSSDFIEVDHVQYGVLVPEARTRASAIVGVLVSAFFHFLKARRSTDETKAIC